MKSSRRSLLLACAAVVVLGWAGLRLWRQFAADDALNQPLHRAVGERLAAETRRLLGGQGRIVVVTLEPGQSPLLDCQGAAFHRALAAARNITVLAVDTPDRDKPGQYGPGFGMSARRLSRLAAKYPQADAVVSLIGVPDPDDWPAGAAAPKLVAVARSPKRLEALFQRRLLHTALVPRFHFPAPGPAEPLTASDWFERQFEVVTPDQALAADAR